MPTNSADVPRRLEEAKSELDSMTAEAMTLFALWCAATVRNANPRASVHFRVDMQKLVEMPFDRQTVSDAITAFKGWTTDESRAALNACFALLHLIDGGEQPDVSRIRSLAEDSIEYSLSADDGNGVIDLQHFANEARAGRTPTVEIRVS